MRKRYLFYFLGIASSLFTVAMVTIDTYISATLVRDPFVYGNASFIAGTISSIILVLILSIPIGGKMPATHLDPNYKGLRILEKREISYHLLAGIGNAVSTLGYYLIIASTRDPSTVLPYTQLAIIYLVLADAIVEKDPPSFAEIEASILPTSLRRTNRSIQVLLGCSTRHKNCCHKSCWRRITNIRRFKLGSKQCRSIPHINPRKQLGGCGQQRQPNSQPRYR